MRGLVNGAAEVDVRASLCLWIIDVCAQTARSASTCRMLTSEHSMYTCARADCQVGLRIRSRLKLGAMRCSSLRRRGWGTYISSMQYAGARADMHDECLIGSTCAQACACARLRVSPRWIPHDQPRGTMHEPCSLGGCLSSCSGVLLCHTTTIT